jgi:hypothetical protein
VGPATAGTVTEATSGPTDSATPAPSAAGSATVKGPSLGPTAGKYIGGWLRGEPSGLGTRIYADGSFLIGYFENGGYLGDSEHYGHRFAGPERQHPSTGVPPDEAGSGHPAPAAAAAEDSPGCEQQCNDLAELELNRITDEYECCYARHAFCVHKVQIEARSCDTQGCLDEQGLEVSERGTLYTK